MSVLALVAAGCGQVNIRAPEASSSPGGATTISGPTGPATSSAPSPRPSGASASRSSSPSATASPSGGASCRSLAASLSRSERVGQLFMVAVPSSGFPASTGSTLDQEHVGSVILLGNSTAGRRAVKRVTDDARSAIKAPAGTRTLLAGDQEGGLVQRFQGDGFDPIPSARQQAALSDSTLRDRAEGWGAQLREAGVDADLAPVADVVPTAIGTANEPIGKLRRGYGPDPSVVANKVGAFVKGMDAAGVATSVKHFPGLGRVRGNTDLTANVVDDTTTRHDRALAGFARAIHDGIDMVMVSSAIYAKIDGRGPATFSTTVITGMIRGDLGFDGVVISDDMAGKALTGYSPGQRAIRFVRAGGDLVIMGDLANAPTMIDAVATRAADDAGFDAAVTTAATRVLTMKARRGLADCS
ncbi:MAG: glycoside hydrolase family 3 N-terminal domain-containing protein [Propionibacteriaceae bacterium]